MRITVYQNSERDESYTTPNTEIRVGRARKDPNKVSVPENVTFIGLANQSISSNHVTVKVSDGGLEVVDTSRNGSLIKVGGKAVMLRGSSQTFPLAGKSFQLEIGAKGVVYLIKFYLDETCGSDGEKTEHTDQAEPTERTEGETASEGEPARASSAKTAPKAKTSKAAKPAKTAKAAKAEASATTAATAEKAVRKSGVLLCDDVKPEDALEGIDLSSSPVVEAGAASVEKKARKPRKRSPAEQDSDKTEKRNKREKAAKKDELKDILAADDEIVMATQKDDVDLVKEDIIEDSSSSTDDDSELEKILDSSESEESVEEEEEEFEGQDELLDAVEDDVLFSSQGEASDLSYSAQPGYAQRRALIPRTRRNLSRFEDVLETLSSSLRKVWAHYCCPKTLETLEDLNIKVEDGLSPSAVEVYFTSKIRRSARYLVAIQCGLPIVNEKWVLHCRKTVLRDESEEFPGLKRYLMNPSVDEMCDGDPVLLRLMPKDWSLPRLLARNHRYPLVLGIADYVIVTPEAVLGRPISESSPAEDIVAIYGFGQVCAHMGVLGCTVVYPEDYDSIPNSEEAREACPEIRKPGMRKLRPDSHAEDVIERIKSAVLKACVPATPRDDDAEMEMEGISGPRRAPPRPLAKSVLILVPPSSDEAYEQYEGLKGDASAVEGLEAAEGVTIKLMARQGIIYSIVTGSPMFDKYLV